MTGTIDIFLHANHPDEPVPKHYVFQGSPSCPRIVNVPAKVGSWEIEDVYMSVTFPDGTMRTVDAVDSDGTFVATIPACSVAGTVKGGFQVIADFTDESGEAFEGLCLGVGDLEVLPRDGEIRRGGSVRVFHIVDEVPESPKTGEATVIDGSLKWYDGADWKPFGNFEIDATLSRPDLAADAKATGDAIAGRRGLTDLVVYEDKEVRHFVPFNLPHPMTFAGSPVWSDGSEIESGWWWTNNDGYRFVAATANKDADELHFVKYPALSESNPEFDATQTIATEPGSTDRRLATTAETSGMAKFGPDGTLVQAVPGVDYDASTLVDEDTGEMYLLKVKSGSLRLYKIENE